MDEATLTATVDNLQTLLNDHIHQNAKKFASVDAVLGELQTIQANPTNTNTNTGVN